MKKLAVIILVLAMVSSVYAQESSKNEVFGGFGLWTFTQFYENLFGVDAGYTMNASTIPLLVGYNYAVNRRLSLSGVFVYESYTITKESDDTSQSKDLLYTLAAEGTFNYLNKDLLKIYGSAGVGLSLLHERNDPGYYRESRYAWMPNIQFTPVGVKIGKKYGWFAEVGLGYRGVFNTGLFARF
jgi:hypothetical protein